MLNDISSSEVFSARCFAEPSANPYKIIVIKKILKVKLSKDFLRFEEKEAEREGFSEGCIAEPSVALYIVL